MPTGGLNAYYWYQIIALDSAKPVPAIEVLLYMVQIPGSFMLEIADLMLVKLQLGDGFKSL